MNWRTGPAESAFLHNLAAVTALPTDEENGYEAEPEQKCLFLA